MHVLYDNEEIAGLIEINLITNEAQFVFVTILLNRQSISLVLLQ